MKKTLKIVGGFVAALREAKRPDGTKLREPMANMPTYARNMTDTEVQALWKYLQSVPAVKARK